MTVKKALAETLEYFMLHQVASPRLEAELLVSHALKLNRVALHTQSEKALTIDELDKVWQLAYRRAEGEPTAYLLGEKEFFSLSLFVTKAVLIPRPETEILVEQGLRCLTHGSNIRVIDVGTGSGAIAIALKKERPALEMIAVDKSLAALQIAKKNAHRFGTSIHFVQSDLLQAFSKALLFDLIISNPPYVPSLEIFALAKEVQTEPWAALDGGPDGLVVIRRLIEESSFRLKEGGVLIMEVGHDQAEMVALELQLYGYCEVEITKDLAQIARVVSGKKSSASF